MKERGIVKVGFKELGRRREGGTKEVEAEKDIRIVKERLKELGRRVKGVRKEEIKRKVARERDTRQHKVRPGGIKRED